MRAPIVALCALLSAAAVVAGCEPLDKPPRSAAKPPPCPPPPEPERVAVVVGSIGKMHMAESRYGLSRLGDVIAAAKPDLVLVGVRPDAFREGRLEEAPFEMTYVTHVAKQHGAAVEAIDWFRDEDLGAEPSPLEPFDVAELARRESEVLGQPRLYTFEQANGAELATRVLLARRAEQRYRGGAPVTSRRSAWMQHLLASAVQRHDRPKRVVAVVDVLDRPELAGVLDVLGYATRSPVDVMSKAKEVMVADIPADVMTAWEKQLERAATRAKSAKGADKAFWTERAHVLSVVVQQKAACCVTTSALSPAAANGR